MIRLVSRALVTAFVGALAGPACLLLAHTANRAVTFDMDRDLPAFATGFYPVERDAAHGFAWTSRRADIVLAGLDRRSTWSCSVRFRGARPSLAAPQPEVTIALDGVSAVVRPATNEYQEVDVRVPSRPFKPGLILAISSSSTFVPGGSDRRTLGVQVQRLSCRPLDAWLVLPPAGALGRAAFGAAAFGAAFGLSGIAMGYAAGATALVAAGQAVPL
jgi:hypothetical protein